MKAGLFRLLEHLEARLGPPEPAFAAGDLIDALAVFGGDWKPGEDECDASARALGFPTWAEQEVFISSMGQGRSAEEFGERLRHALVAVFSREYGIDDPAKILPADLARLAERARKIMADQGA